MVTERETGFPVCSVRKGEENFEAEIYLKRIFLPKLTQLFSLLLMLDVRKTLLVCVKNLILPETEAFLI